MPSKRRFKTKEDYNTWFRAYRAANREKFREYNREYNRQWRRKNGYHHEIASKAKYPEKELARRLLREAVAAGVITKLPCATCGIDKSEAHHDDHSKPLEVSWLCRQHHTEVHRPFKGGAIELLPAILPTRAGRVRVHGRSKSTKIQIRLSACTFCGAKRIPFRPHIKCAEARERIRLSKVRTVSRQGTTK